MSAPADLDALWSAVAHVAHARLAVISAGVEALATGAADAGVRRAAAVDECHKLVGSLDSYGRVGGSALALRTAELLDTPQPDLPSLRAALAGLQQTIGATP